MEKELTKKQTAKNETDPNREQEIRRRAYALYEERGHEDGHDVDDWLRAEADINASAQKAAAQRQLKPLAPRDRGRSFIC